MTIQNIEAEQSVLGSILLDPDKLYECRKQNLNLEDFSIYQHQIIYQALNKLFDNNTAIDPVTLINELRLSEQLDNAGGLSYVIGLPNVVPTSKNIYYYIKILNDLSFRRKFLLNIDELSIAAKTVDIADLVNDYNNIKELLRSSAPNIELYNDGTEIKFSKEPSPCISTGFSAIDEACGGGLPYGSVTILSGDPGSGKSTFVNQLIAQAIFQGVGSFLYSGEISSETVMRLLVDTIANEKDLLDRSYILKNTTHVKDEAIEEIYSWLKQKIFLYSSIAMADEEHLALAIEQLATEKNVRFVVLDNLMTLEFRGNDKYEKQSAVIKLLKKLATSYQLVIILIAHPNKSTRVDKDPHVFSISGASEISNMADYIFMLNRAEDYVTYLSMLKNRVMGTQGKKIKLNFSISRRRFYSDDRAELVRDFGY